MSRLFWMILLPGGQSALNNPVKNLNNFQKIEFKISDTRETTNIQPHGGAWMPADRSFDRILFWYS